MPELFGYAIHSKADPRKGPLADMQRSFLALRDGNVQTDELPWAGIGTVRWHKHDPASLRRVPRSAVRLAWIGVHPLPTQRRDFADLISDIVRGDTRCLLALDLPFAAAILQEPLRRTWLLSDPCGLHPVYYFERNGAILFATKTAPLFKNSEVEWQLDRRAVLDFFTFEHLTDSRTFGDSIKLLPAGSLLTFDDGRLEIRSYLPTESRKAAPPELMRQTADRLYEALSQSVGRALPSSGRVGVPLSGGLDSRALLGLAVERGADVRTYTFGALGCDDVSYARRVARASGVPHAVVDIDGSHLPRWMEHGLYVTGGMMSCIHYHILALADLLGAEVDLVLDGLGGDALTGGHLKWGMLFAGTIEKAVDAVYQRQVTVCGDGESREALFDRDFIRGTNYEPREAVRRQFLGLEEAPRWLGCHRFDLIERQRRFIQLGPHLLRPLVDVRTPMYAPDILELMSGIRVAHLIEQRAFVRMHSRYLTSLARIPDTARKVPLSWPMWIRFSKKVIDFCGQRLRRCASAKIRSTPTMPTDYATWFRQGLADFVRERLLDGSSPLDGVIQRKAVERVVTQHLTGTSDHTAMLGCLLTFDGWYRGMRRYEGTYADAVRIRTARHHLDPQKR